MERNLLDYLPLFLRDYAEFQGIASGEQPEFEAVWGATNNLLENQFVSTSDNLGLSRWESILDITPKGMDSLTNRRIAVIARLNERLPYTLPRLRELLTAVCGTERCSADVKDYTLRVTVPLEAKESYDAVVSLLERIAPYNLMLDLIQLYNTHGELGGFTHGALSPFTHEQLRNEVLPRGD